MPKFTVYGMMPVAFLTTVEAKDEEEAYEEALSRATLPLAINPYCSDPKMAKCEKWIINSDMDSCDMEVDGIEECEK